MADPKPIIKKMNRQKEIENESDSTYDYVCIKGTE
jgi:hypothetical protein